MAVRKPKKDQRDIESYEHRNKERKNNPLAGLVTPENDPDQEQGREYTYDPHLDPQLDWAGKREHISFDVPTVSLHVHERIDPRTIIKAVQNKEEPPQQLLFDEERSVPIREAIDFYQHEQNWSNRLIAGDSLLVMNSLLEKESMEGKVQMVFIDPPYGIKYGSNFQPFVNKRIVEDGKDEDLTGEPEQIRAFRDTWELGIHSYLSYLRDRLLLTHNLLTSEGSVFVQINEDNVHRVRLIMDEVFGSVNFVRMISFIKTSNMSANFLGRTCDYLLWYSKDKSESERKYRPLFDAKQPDDFYTYLELPDGSTRKLKKEERSNLNLLPKMSKVFKLAAIESPGNANNDTPFEFNGEIFRPSSNRHWSLNYPNGMEALKKTGRIIKSGNKLWYKNYLSDFPVKARTEHWADTASSFSTKRYVVETRRKVIERCLLMATDPGDIVLDPTCGSGTTAIVAEQWGRRWITCDTSRISVTLARQRLITAVFDYYKLAHPHEGIGSGLVYETVPHHTTKSVADITCIKESMSVQEIENIIAEHAPKETLYDKPLIDSSVKRVCGPFTVEAVPAPTVLPINNEDNKEEIGMSDNSISRRGVTQFQGNWREELLRTGVRTRFGQHIKFTRLEVLPACHWLHADGEIQTMKENIGSKKSDSSNLSGQRTVVSFGPKYAPLEQRQVELALQEASTLKPKPTLVIFAAFQFDAEAAKDIDETNWPGVKLVKAQMNNDLLTEDLKKKRASNESFWLIGQPDIKLHNIRKGEYTGYWQVEVCGFDYFNMKTGNIESGNVESIPLWMLDTDYDGRCLYPRQVFFPMDGKKGDWAKLAKDLKAEIDQDLIEAYRGTVSLPFELGKNERIAVKLVDNRGIESLKVIRL